jgi:FMN phosphatase YigB (HAD superfamily)
MRKVFFLDIDDCLIKTSKLTKKHLAAVSNSLKSCKIRPAGNITEEFAASFHRLYDRHQGITLDIPEENKFKEYFNRLEELEKPVTAKFGEIKKWSREVCLFIAGEKFGVKLSNKVLLSASNSLWEKITGYATFYPDALNFLNKLITRGIPFYLITSSDSRLTRDDETGLFQYDPDYSRRLKMNRLRKFLDLGIPEKHIFIGDPIDKPDPYIFREALLLAKKEAGINFESIMVGDSVSNDLIPAQKAGMDKFIWINRINAGNKQKNIENLETVSDFSQIYL